MTIFNLVYLFLVLYVVGDCDVRRTLRWQRRSGRPQRRRGLQVDLVRSYLAFASRAIRPRRLWVALVLVAGLVLTSVVLRYSPRTYKARRLDGPSNPVLDANNGPGALAGAPT